MNDHNQKLEPTRFDPGTGENDRTGGEGPGQFAVAAESPRQSPRRIMAALLGLVLLSIAVFFWLPGLVPEPRVELAQPTRPVAKKLPGAQISPWSDAQLQRQRKGAQDVLAQLLEEQFKLQESGVEQWAPAAFSAALELATRGDEQYRQQEFLAATDSYQAGLEAMLDIAADVSAIFAKHLRRGLAALQNNRVQPALNELQLAQLIQPDSAEVAHALGRAMNLEQVMALGERAAQARRANDPDSAARLLAEAAALDPEHRQVRAELIAVRSEISNRDFNQAMTRGYEALDSGDYDAAQTKFLAARRIMPGAGETESALQQARTLRARAQIDQFAERARQAEEREDWSQASSDYQAILDIDETVAFARSGLTRSKARADLDQRLRNIIEQPRRLAEDRVYEVAQSTWREGSGIDRRGPRLNRQLEKVHELLRVARTPVPILLQSDDMTQVTVYKVARLGAFRRHPLELKPGTYTAVGARTGFRDVRRQFTVAADQPNPVIEISCTEPI